MNLRLSPTGTGTSRPSKLKWLNLPGLLTVLLLLAFTSVEASHYRYGTISWQREPGSCEIEVTVKQAWRRTFYAPNPNVGDLVNTTTLHLRTTGGASLHSEAINLSVTSVNLGDDWFFGEYTTTISLPSCTTTYQLTYESNARISTLSNNANLDFGSVAIVTPYNDGNDSPVSSQTPIVNLAAGNPAAAFPLSGVDPNGDPLTFRVATAAEAGGNSNAGSSHPDFSVAANGTATFNTVGKSNGNQYNVWYAVEDNEGALILGDFIIEIVDSGASLPPVFDFAVTPSAHPCITANPGDLVTFTVKADDPDPDDSVYISAVGVPGGATHLPTLPTDPHKPDSTVFSWTPGPGDVGTTVITYTAEDDGGLQTSTSICIEVTTDSISDTACVVSDSLTVVTDTSWRLSTVVTPSNFSGVWGGVGGVLPPDASFTLPAVVGQPYPFPTIDSADGAQVIEADNNIRYYRKQFMMSGDDDVAARLMLTVDDHIEVYVNGFLLAAQYTGNDENFKSPPFEVTIMEDGSIMNPSAGGDAMSFVTLTDLDDIFSGDSMNTMVVAVRNYAKATDRGGFSIMLDLHFNDSTGVCEETKDSLVSDTTWLLSTVVTTAGSNMYPWPGVGSHPALGTFTLPADVGQPYPWTHLYTVPGSEVITALSGITYYLKTFELTDHEDVNARIRMYMDDDVEIFINGHLLAREDDTGPQNWRTVNHDILFAEDGSIDNGHMGGDEFDYAPAVDLDTVLQTGVNNLVLAIRNRTSKPDKGGFSFRMDVDKGGSSVIKKSSFTDAPAQAGAAFVEAYPNPARSWVNLVIEAEMAKGGGDIEVLDLNGRVLQTLEVTSAEVQVNLAKYATGLYLIKVDAGGQSHTLKVFKH